MSISHLRLGCWENLDKLANSCQQVIMGQLVRLFILIALILLTADPTSSQKHRGDEAKYTTKEARAIVQLRKAVEKDLYEDYMSRDEYLVRWLRTKKLDVNKAAELLRKNLKWRKEENADSMADEEFPQFSGFLYENRVRDKEGRPVSLFAYSTWDTRKAG